jgi:maltose alpha-D-glucosyltransferase/alpha-amylase
MASTDRRGNDPLWYKDAIIYELHIRAFFDSDADGMGDFRGLARKLDYIHDLGVTSIWLLPFYPSPWRDDGYDISDYMDVHPAYGTLADFRVFLREAHARGLRVITELVLNHTSDQHAWFQRARRAAPGSPERDFYVWSDTASKYPEARIIFKDFETSNWTWDPVAQAYYWHRFYSHQPDLNFDNPAVHEALYEVVDFWLGMGVDGLRLDAIPYLYEREGTNCENLPETYTFLTNLRHHVDQKFRNRMLLAEANQWPEDAVAYFGAGDRCHMAFHFPLMPRMFMAVRMEDRYPIIDILEQTPPIAESTQWALFLRNHDELTLEMVTDEERDYMYRMYAHDPRARINLGIRHRLAPLLGKDWRRIELMNVLLFSLPGTPVIYYGDEIGMGDNIYLGDRDGVRTPMQWSADRNAGFSRANSQQLYLPVIIDPEYLYEACNVEAQQNNPHSSLWFMKRLIGLRKRFRAFGRGTLEFLYPENGKVLAFLRKYEDETILVVANLSRLAQYVELDLASFAGSVPTELFGGATFPPVTDKPYLLTLGPHGFYWFSLAPRQAPLVLVTPDGAVLPQIEVTGGWEAVFRGRAKAVLESALPVWLGRAPWFKGKVERVKSVQIVETVLMAPAYPLGALTLVQVEYTDADPEMYCIPVSYADRTDPAAGDDNPALIARLTSRDGDGVVYGALRDSGFCEAILDAIGRRRRFNGTTGQVFAMPTRFFRELRGSDDISLPPVRMKLEHSNSLVNYGDRLVLKLFRRVESGIHPELEIGSFLSEYAVRGKVGVPLLAGAIQYRRKNADPITLAVLHSFIPHQADGWNYTVDALGRYFERVAAGQSELQAPVAPHEPLVDLARVDVPVSVREAVGTYCEVAATLGRRAAELHTALASNRDNPNIAPEPFTALYQRSLYQSLRDVSRRVFGTLHRRLPELPEGVRADAQKVLALEGAVRARFRSIADRKITAMRIRIHGDLHLAHVLATGRDFVVIDFEGISSRPIGERRLKRSAVRDVAGMLRSFHYAAHSVLLDQTERGFVRPDDLPKFEPWAQSWQRWVSAMFLRAYLETAAVEQFLPTNAEELQLLLDVYMLERAIHELHHELLVRPRWLPIPLHAILQLASSEAVPVE